MTPPCCREHQRYVETLWEIEGGVRRVRRLGEVVVCSKHHRPIGDVKRASTGRCLSEVEWQRMLAHRASPPWYFVKGAESELLPEGWQRPAVAEPAP